MDPISDRSLVIVSSPLASQITVPPAERLRLGKQGAGIYGHDTPNGLVPPEDGQVGRGALPSVNQGFELRAFFRPVSRLEKYKYDEWHTGQRGFFPSDYVAWLNEKCNMYERGMSLTDITAVNST